MNNMNIQIRHKQDGQWKNLYPHTLAENIFDETGEREIVNARNGKSSLKARLDDEHQGLTTQLQQAEQSLNSQLQQTNQNLQQTDQDLQQTKQTLNAHLAVKGSGVNANLTLINNWVGMVRWRRSDGNIVTVEVDIANNTPDSILPLKTIATLPPAIRTFEKVVPIVSVITGDVEFLYINLGGELRTPATITIKPGHSYHGVITYTI